MAIEDFSLNSILTFFKLVVLQCVVVISTIDSFFVFVLILANTYMRKVHSPSFRGQNVPVLIIHVIMYLSPFLFGWYMQNHKHLHGCFAKNFQYWFFL